MKKVGIDDIAAYSPRLYVDGSEFETARNKKQGHMTVGIGIQRMSVPDIHEDANTMAAMSVVKLLHQNNLTPKDIGRFEVATETSYDESKAANAYIIGMIEQLFGKCSCEHWGGVERKFACASAGYTVFDAVNWIRADENEGKPAIVVASDIARYDIEPPEERTKGLGSECTQGGGSVSMLIGENPRLLNIEPKVTDYAIVDERDFYRPFGKKTAIVDSDYSNLCYLLTMRKAFDKWKGRALKNGVIKIATDETVLDYTDRMISHMPYPRMAEYNHAFLLRHEWRKLPRWKEITDVIGDEPQHEEGTIETILKNKSFMEKDATFRRNFVKTPQFIRSYKEKVENSRKISEQVANIYTGSLPLGLLSLFEVECKQGIDLGGKRIGQGYYASGATALVTSGIVSESYRDAAKNFRMLEELEKRRKISIKEYEDLHEGLRRESIIQPHKEFALVGETNGYRQYKLVG
jgi:hydroxymethylglutaryl-CoA synthase